MLAGSKPRIIVAREMQLFVLVCLYGCVDGQWVQGIHSGVRDCADDPGWADDVPVCSVGFAVCEEFVFLWVVEVWLDGAARIRLDERRSCWALVDLGFVRMTYTQCCASVGLHCSSLLLSAAGNVSVGCSLMVTHRANFPGEPL